MIVVILYTNTDGFYLKYLHILFFIVYCILILNGLNMKYQTSMVQQFRMNNILCKLFYFAYF